jgi:hypothetical protein
MGTNYYFHDLKVKFAPDVRKLYRVNQRKVLSRIRATSAAGTFDDVRGGVCFALSFTWLYAMLDSSHRSDSYGLFTDRYAQPVGQARYFRDEKVIEVQRAYLNRGKGRPTSWQHENDFLKALVPSRGLALLSHPFNLSLVGTTLPDAVTKILSTNDVLDTQRSQALGVCIGIKASPSEKTAIAHAVAVFRKRRPADAPLVFFDPNCGCYSIKDDATVRKQFFGAWLDAYKAMPMFRRAPFELDGYFVVST